MWRDASMLPCVLLGDSSETDPLGCLQPLIAITPKWKQSIQPPTTPCTPPPPLSLSLSQLSQSSFLRSSFFFSCFRPHSSQSAHFYRSGKKMCLIGGGVMRFMGAGTKWCSSNAAWERWSAVVTITWLILWSIVHLSLSYSGGCYFNL